MKTLERITEQDVAVYKREILEQTVLVAPSEAARILSCAERTVRRLVQEGRIHAYNLPGRPLRLLASELRDYVRSLKIDREKWRE